MLHALRCAVMCLGLLPACAREDPLQKKPITVLAQIGEVGISKGQFSYPRCIDHDAEALWVIDKGARVQRLDPTTGRYLGGWKMPKWLLGKPTGVTVGKGDGGETLLYVADTHYHRILIYRPGDASEGEKEPELVGEFGSFGQEPGQFVYPTDVAVLMEEDGSRPKRLYVSEYGGNDRISIWEHTDQPNSYRCVSTIGRFGSSAAPDAVEFSRPQSMEIDRSKHELIVTDACNQRIGRLTLDGKLIAWYGSPDTPDDQPGHFKYPYGLCLLDDGSAMVAEFGNNRVQRIDLANGQSLGCYGVPGRGEGQLATPWGVTVLKDRVYVLDSGNNRVLAFAKPRKLVVAGGV